MSAAPQEAIAEAAVDPAAGSPAEAAPASPMPPTAAEPAPPPTVEIYGKQVLVADLVAHFDPECPDRCTEGMITVMRPMPKPFKSTMPVKELCACTVRRYVAEHPPEAVGGLSKAARAVLAPARASHTTDGAREKLGRLRGELSKETTRILSIRARAAEKTSDGEAELASIAAAEADLVAAAASRGQRWASAQKRHDELVEQLRAVDLAILAIDSEDTIAKEAAERSGARRRVLEETIAAARAKELPVEGPALKSIEKLERRIAAVLIHHPELADG